MAEAKKSAGPAQNAAQGSAKSKRNPNVIVAIIIAVVLVVGGIAWFAWQSSQQATTDTLVARVHDGDGGTTELPLGQDTTKDITSSLGTNTVEVADGAIHVESATCSNKDCIRQGAISQLGQQIICLPNQMWIEIVHEGDADGTMDATKTPDSSSASSDGDSSSSFDTKSR